MLSFILMMVVESNLYVFFYRYQAAKLGIPLTDLISPHFRVLSEIRWEVIVRFVVWRLHFTPHTLFYGRNFPNRAQLLIPSLLKQGYFAYK
jgi:hypothetical protein